MDRAQARFLGDLRRHIHDSIKGRYEPHYARVTIVASGALRLDKPGLGTGMDTVTGWEGKRASGVASIINQMEDRLFEPGARRVAVGAGGGQLRGARMFDPRRPEGDEQEQMLSDEDQQVLVKLSVMMRGVSGESKAWLGAFLQSDQATLRNDELQRLKKALLWLKAAEAAFESIPMKIDLVRRRRLGISPMSIAVRVRGQEGLPAEVSELASKYVVDDQNKATLKEIDDGDVFNDFSAGLGQLMQAWFKIARAMTTAPPEEQPSVEEMQAAAAQEGEVYLMRAGPGETLDPETGMPVRVSRAPTGREGRKAYREAFGEEIVSPYPRGYLDPDDPERLTDPAAVWLREYATPNRRMKANETFGWPLAAWRES